MNQPSLRPLLLIILIITAGITAEGKDPSPKTNQYKNGKYHGKWIIYFDSTNTKIESAGRYKLGKETGTWRYYFENGNLRRLERFRGSHIRTTHFYETGIRKSSGKARLRYEGEYLHYYYHGKWKYFNPDGSLREVIEYKNGEEVG